MKDESPLAFLTIREGIKMGRWTQEEDIILLAVMDEYRAATRDKDAVQTNKITRQYADDLYHANHLLQHNRTPEAIFQHLAYLDDLLAGVGSLADYAKKDYHYFAKKQRADNNLYWNPTKRRGYKQRLAIQQRA